MNEMRTGRHPFEPLPGEAEDRFTSEGGSLGPRRPTAIRSALPTARGNRCTGDTGAEEQTQAVSLGSRAPTPHQRELMQDVNVDFRDGAYRYAHQRFLRFEEAIDCAETTRRTRGPNDK